MIVDKKHLKALVQEKTAGHKFIVVSNREPYLHTYTDSGIKCISPASGMSTALNPIMNACGGTWIAHGAGDADMEVVDVNSHISVPPDSPNFTLRRVWLTREEERGYYYGYANEGLWPLCHIVYVRPKFRDKDWQMYKQVNMKFADAVLEEMADDTGFVFIQDYHFALLSRYIKEKRPDIVVAQFWHIPWPNREAFRVCPNGPEILDGLLGNDILGFQIRYHCINFLDTIERAIEAKVDNERFSVIRNNKETLVRPFPISIDFEKINETSCSQNVVNKVAVILNDHRIINKKIAIGLDRIDYTKGIVEKFLAIDRFLEKYSEYVEKFVFLQLGPISRIQISTYKNYNDEVYHTMTEINDKWKIKGWEPIILSKKHLNFEEVLSYYRITDILIVSSMHDGMNLVVKEFIAARNDLKGMVVLSKFTGAARELEDALLVNPLDTEFFADSIYQALIMPEEERRKRMQNMREIIETENVYNWAGKIVNTMKKMI